MGLEEDSLLVNRLVAILVLGTVFTSVCGVFAADSTVIQKGRAFSVRQIEIRVGERLAFVNNDGVTHNVYSETRGLEFEIELQPPGRVDTVRFSRPGLAEVECAIHPSMKLKIVVRP